MAAIKLAFIKFEMRRFDEHPDLSKRCSAAFFAYHIRQIYHFTWL